MNNYQPLKQFVPFSHYKESGEEQGLPGRNRCHPGPSFPCQPVFAPLRLTEDDLCVFYAGKVCQSSKPVIIRGLSA